jgi:hypothetical protein
VVDRHSVAGGWLAAHVSHATHSASVRGVLVITPQRVRFRAAVPDLPGRPDRSGGLSPTAAQIVTQDSHHNGHQPRRLRQPCRNANGDMPVGWHDPAAMTPRPRSPSPVSSSSTVKIESCRAPHIWMWSARSTVRAGRRPMPPKSSAGLARVVAQHHRRRWRHGWCHHGRGGRRRHRWRRHLDVAPMGGQRVQRVHHDGHHSAQTTMMVAIPEV